MIETAPIRFAQGSNSTELPPLVQPVPGRGRPKGRKTGTGTTGPAAKARLKAQKKETTPKRPQAKGISRRDYETAARLLIRAVAGRAPVSAMELAKPFGFADPRDSKEYRDAPPEERAAIDRQLEASDLFVANVTSALRGWLPEADRLDDFEVDLTVRVLGKNYARMNKAAGQWAGPIKRALAPLMPYVRTAMSEAETIALVALLAIPRLTRRGMLPIIFANVIYSALLMAAGRAPGGGGANGVGEVNPDEPSADDAAVRAGAQDETGPGDLPGVQDDGQSEGDGRPAE